MSLKHGAAYAAFLILFSSSCLMAQTVEWESLGDVLPAKSGQEALIDAKDAHYFQVVSDTQMEAPGEFASLDLPFPDGTTRSFSLAVNTTLAPELDAEFPGIRAYNATATDGSGYRGKVDISHKGVRAMLYHPTKPTVFLDPVYSDDNSLYISYRKADFQTTKLMECLADHDDKMEAPAGPKDGIAYNSCELRTYRLAMAATGEYTIFHGGTVADALAAINTTMNRVNGIYERDFAVTMTLIPNTTSLIYTNPVTDPYSNGETFAMINQNQVNVNSVIGSANYDIGHVFGTNSGGLAGLGVTCSNNSKARGVTGSGAPIGDPFDVDYVAHEIGHQFGATHTFNNSCNGNRTDATAMEPGSGTTIMAYAGICPPNIQSNSDDHFHGISMRQIGIEITSDNCPVITSLDNLAPVIDSVTTEFFVPAQTPFALTAYATDPDPEDVLTYNWEQTDNEITPQPPVSTAEEGPNFRSFSPTESPTGYFPRLESLASPGPETWEVLPSVERTMSFRCTVKDNAEGGGCAQFEDAEITVTELAGPFVVTQPSSSGIVWEAFTEEEVTWDVANTNLSPINCAFVDIFLSTDGGLTYDELLAEEVPNTGSALVDVPNFNTVEARVMVMNAGGTFFDVSNNDFTIVGIEDGYLISSTEPEQSTCVGDDLSFEISIVGLGSFNETVTLSLTGDLADIDATLLDDQLAVGETTTLSITSTENVEAGVLDVIVLGTAPSFDQSLNLEAGFNANDTEVPSPASPADGAQFVPTTLTLDWDANPSPDAVYTLEISTTADFSADVTSIQVEGESEAAVDFLEPATTYYWRVNKDTPCSTPEFSSTSTFLTHTCFPFEAQDVPVSISPVAGETISIIDIPYPGTVEDVNVISFQGEHGNVGQFSAMLVSPEGTEVMLFEFICDGAQDFDLAFDDVADTQVIDCPPNQGLVYRPLDELSAFIGEETEGNWTLVITDNVSGGGGTLESWSLEVCVANAGTFQITSESNELSLCQGETATLEVTAEEIFFFEDQITLSNENLPDGVTVTFAPEAVLPGESSTATFELEGDAAEGLFFPIISGNSGDLTSELIIETGINAAQPESPELQAPANEEVTTGFASFDWVGIPSPDAQYELQVAFDEEFNELFTSVGPLFSTATIVEGLPPSSQLYWRVLVNNGCETTASETRSFTTQACGIYDATEGLPFSISPVPDEYVSELEIPLSGVIDGIRISYIRGNHFRVSDLQVFLESPSGTEVQLFDSICPGSADFDLGFVDGGEAVINCPPTDGLFYAPDEALSVFEGEDPQGIWQLKVNDLVSGGGGQFDGWALEICYNENVFSTSNVDPDSFNLYPNPAQEEVVVDIPDGVEVSRVMIFDVSGRLIGQLQETGIDVLLIDIAGFRSGVYFVRLEGEFGSVTKRVVKNK